MAAGWGSSTSAGRPAGAARRSRTSRCSASSCSTRRARCSSRRTPPRRPATAGASRSSCACPPSSRDGVSVRRASAICTGISQGLGFGRVVVQLAGQNGDVLEPAAAVGIELEEAARGFRLHDDELDRLLHPAFENEGCYLLSLDEGKKRVPSYQDTFPSQRNGRGPAAWDHHWLVVPLVDRTGARLGAVFVDDPADLLLPARDRLQALRLFASQASTALESSAQYETMRHLADCDRLTKFLKRRAFVRQSGCSPRARDRPATGAPLLRPRRVQDGQRHPRPPDGDRVRRMFSAALTGAVRHGDSVFRMGGDEFAL